MPVRENWLMTFCSMQCGCEMLCPVNLLAQNASLYGAAHAHEHKIESCAPWCLGGLVPLLIVQGHRV